jgi:hypothetical protein
MEFFKNLGLFIFGAIAFVVMFVFFMLDRIVLVPMIWKQTIRFNEWYKETEETVGSFIRVLTVLIIYFLLSWLLN